jgi:hypothetical protein|tara:strand:+ start:261 stop:410 length:150 start_codon:yes stop_codon:yes gene_type:complete
MSVDIRQLLNDLDKLTVACKALNKDLMSISKRAQKLALNKTKEVTRGEK